MNYWDTSALVPLLIHEADTEKREQQLIASEGLVTWWGTRLECVSALARREREGVLPPATLDAAMKRLESLAKLWMIVPPTRLVPQRAERLLRLHPLRAADALQLAAALIASRENPAGSCFHSADTRLADAASREGFTLF